ncbi:MAG: hypothetical protein HY720_31210, partial [Planctomycetes bacterium]|nr:hypothetical protein [Planctomycetota bacterium]
MTPTPVLYTHCRREARRTMSVPASVALVDSGGHTLAGGKAVLVDFSTGGAKFARVELIGRTLPLGIFRVEFELVG